MKRFKKLDSEFETPYTCMNAIKQGGLETKLSMVLMGFGNMVHGQRIKGLLYLAIEVFYILCMVMIGVGCIAMLPSLCIFLCGSTAVPEERKPPVRWKETVKPEQGYRT